MPGYYDDVCHCAVAFCGNHEVIDTINFTITYNYNSLHFSDFPR